MIFFKILRYDLQNGLLKQYKKFVLAGLLFLLLAFDFSLRRIGIMQIFESDGSTFGDFLFYIFGGMEEYIPGPGMPFRFPALWMLVFLLAAYITVYYPYHDLMGYGRHVLIHSRSRGRWWLSKCFWIGASSLIYFALLYLIVSIVCIIQKIPLDLNLSESVLYYYIGEPMNGNFPERMTAQLLIMPMLLSISLGFLQLVLSLFIKPLYSFVISVTVLTASAYYLNPLMPGNYGMARRSSLLVDNGVDIRIGAMILLGVIVICAAGGYLTFRRYDILNKE